MNMDVGRWRRALALSEQWRNYSDPDPYMLINVGLTFLAMGKCDAAREAFQHVLTLPTDAATYLANLFLSVLALWDENLPEAQRMLRNAQLFLKDRQWQFVKEFMAVLLQALQELEQSPQDGIKTEHWRTMVRLAKTYADVRRWRYVRTFLWKSLQLLLRKDRSWRSKWQALRVWLGV
jgi:tetratricopeptide (TPR) repeat protein